jgi:hypothetical protein
MIRVHPDTFKATVNTAIIVVEREEPPSASRQVSLVPDSHGCLMGDLTQISIHEHYTRFLQLLYRTTAASEVGEDTSADVHIMAGDDWRSESSPEYALYQYPQNLILTNSNIPFFVASPKLFALMNDQTAPVEYREIDGKQVSVRKIEMNSQNIELTKLGDIAEVKVGLQTGDNDAYLFQNPEARGNYRSIEDYQEYLLTEEDLEQIRSNEELRLSVIENGISKDDPASDRYFGGRYIVAHDKGGESDIGTGWLPNYFVKSNYFIDWSEWAVHRIKTLLGPNGRPRSRFQNTDYLFVTGIDYSQTGVYCPTFRINSAATFNTEATSIFYSKTSEALLGKLCSKAVKLLIKSFIDQTVHASADKLKETFLPLKDVSRIEELTHSIVENQKSNPRYDYASNEQLEIDRLVYEAYGLNVDDIREVENWYARRYPALAAAQRANLERKLAAEREAGS